MIVSMILAMSTNGIIGKDGGLPWRISADLKHFKATTMGKPMVMGRKTWESLGKPLPGRAHIVISSNPRYQAKGATVVGSLPEALKLAETMAGATGTDEVMVIGGAQIYQQAQGLADRIYLTEVHGDFDGDTTMASFNGGIWQEVSREDHVGDPSFSFTVLERSNNGPGQP